MHARMNDFMSLDRRLFPRDIADALAEHLKNKGYTAKQASRRYDIDQSTAENLRKGVCALSTLLKIVLVEGRDLWNALGDEIYGETLDAYEERRLLQIINEASDAEKRLVQLRARREVLDARATSAVSALDRPASDANGLRHG